MTEERTEKPVSKGDIVRSSAGRDKGRLYLVIRKEERAVFVADGRHVKADKPKRKNIRHIIKVCETALTEVVEKIERGEPVGKENLFKAIRGATEKN